MRSGISILRNTLALAVPNILNPFISFILVMVISRSLGREGLGAYALVHSYVSLFGTFATLGLATLIVREAARRPEEAHLFFGNALLFGTVSSLVWAGIMEGLIFSLGYGPDVTRAALIYGFSLFATTGTSYLEAMFRSFEKSHYIALTHVIENILKVGLCLLLLAYGFGIPALFAVMLGTRIFAFAFMMACYTRALGRPALRLRRDIWTVLIREAPTFASIAIFSSVYLGTDDIILSKLRDIETVGVYSAADRLVDICKMLPFAFGAALLPVLTREHTRGLTDLRELTISSLRYMFLVTIPIAVGGCILADEIITLIYGTKFMAAGLILKVHVWSLVPFGVVYLFAEVLIVTDYQRVDLAINMIGAVLNVLFNFLFIYLWGAIGAALASLVTVLTFVGFQYWFIRGHLFPLPLVSLISRTACAAAGMGIATYALRGWNLFATIALSAVLYAVLIVVFRALTEEETAFVRNAVKSRCRRHSSGSGSS